MTKKLLSIILSCVLVLSLAVVGIVAVSAVQYDDNGCYKPADGVETERYYFLMPTSWESEEYGATCAGAYWYGDSTDADDGVNGVWPGYKLPAYDEDVNLYYIDRATDGVNIIFNNYLNGGTRTVNDDGTVTYATSEGQFLAAKQTVDIGTEFYSEGDSDLYDELLDGEFWTLAEEALEDEQSVFLGNFRDNFFIDTEYDSGISFSFDNMIYIIDPEKTSVNDYSGKETFGGEWYFFYGKNEETGNYEYGSLPNYEMAVEEGLVYVVDASATPDQASTDPSTDDNDNTETTTVVSDSTVPTAGQDATSATDAVSTSDTSTTSDDSSAVQTGATTAAVVLAVVLIAGGAVLYTRKRFE